MARNFVLIAALALIGLLAFLTVADAVSVGITPLGLVSLAILAVLGVGAVGALTQKPDE
jgi:hypothetical protein